VSLRIEGDRIVATWRARGVRTRKTWANTATHRKEAVAWAEAFAVARLGLVRTTGEERPTRSGRMAEVWTVTEARAA
jgi:hypothetical protein